MKIKLHEISIAELTNGYVDNNESGVRGYDGKLDIRPPYQREFIYDDAQRNAVIETIFKGFPLNAMYWGLCVTMATMKSLMDNSAPAGVRILSRAN